MLGDKEAIWEVNSYYIVTIPLMLIKGTNTIEFIIPIIGNINSERSQMSWFFFSKHSWKL